MAKQVTVLGLEGDVLRGVRLEEAGTDYVRRHAEAWSLAVEKSSATLEDELAAEAAKADEVSTEEVVEEDRPLARAFTSAVKVFGTHEFSLSLPLSKLLVKTVRLPVEARDDLLGAAQLALDGISPFPDEALTPTAEVVAETDAEITVVMTALPEATSAEITEALTVAKAHVVRTDVSALAWLRALWPQITEKGDVRRRLVLLNLDGGWDLIVLDDGTPTFLRGLGGEMSAEELGREVTLSLLQHEMTGDGVDEIAVFARAAVADDVRARLEQFGPTRSILVEDDFAGVEGAARREVEGSALDVTPAEWTEDRVESRFRRKLFAFLVVAVGIGLTLIGGLFAVDAVYDFLTDRQKGLQKEKVHAKAYKEVRDLKARVELIRRYADHGRGALEVFKKVCDSLPPSPDMTFASYSYVRGDKVRVQGSMAERDDVNVFKENLLDAVYGDGEAEQDMKIFGEVKQAGSETQMKNGLYRFAYECIFPQEDGDTKGGR